MVRNRWRQELRKPRSEGGATICEKHDFALEHYSDPEMGYEVGEALRQAKDDGQRMEKRLRELGEEANNLEECLRDAESERDRLREELERVRREPSPEEIDIHLDRVLRASGSALRNYSLASFLRDKMRKAMREAMESPRAAILQGGKEGRA